MNYTKSGIIAVGAPHSLVRCKNEAQNAFDTCPHLLLLTEEGNNIANRFFVSLGYSPTVMPDEFKSECLNRASLFQFLDGYLMAANHHDAS